MQIVHKDYDNVLLKGCVPYYENVTVHPDAAKRGVLPRIKKVWPGCYPTSGGFDLIVVGEGFGPADGGLYDRGVLVTIGGMRCGLSVGYRLVTYNDSGRDAVFRVEAGHNFLFCTAPPGNGVNLVRLHALHPDSRCCCCGRAKCNHHAQLQFMLVASCSTRSLHLLPFVGLLQTVVVTVGGRASPVTEDALFSYDPPIIDYFTPSNPDALSGGRTGLTGRNFGETEPRDMQVRWKLCCACWMKIQSSLSLYLWPALSSRLLPFLSHLPLHSMNHSFRHDRAAR